MTWLSYFLSCHLWIDSFNSGLVSYDLTLLLLVFSLWLDYRISGIVIYDLTLFLILLVTTCLSYFWSCHLLLDSLISGFVIIDFTLLTIWYYHLCLDSLISGYVSYYWSLSSLVLPTTTCLSPFWSCLYDLTFLNQTKQIQFDSHTSGFVITY